MLTDKSLFQIGVIIGTYGYKGQLRIKYDENLNLHLEKGSTVFFKINNKPVPFFIDNVTFTGSNSAIIQFDDINTKDKAKNYIDIVILIDKDEVITDIIEGQLPIELIGFIVENSSGEKIGTIINTFDNSGQLLLEVEYQSRIVYLPYHEDLFISIEDEQQILRLKIPDGLLKI